jgi:hypothetical protein
MYASLLFLAQLSRKPDAKQIMPNERVSRNLFIRHYCLKVI